MKYLLVVVIAASIVACNGSTDTYLEACVTNTGLKQAFLNSVGDLNDFAQPRPLVPIQAFFEGNCDPSSIGYNLPVPPRPQELYRFLQTIQSRSDVMDVLIQVQQLEDPDGWPSADTIWFITSSSSEEVHSWFPENLAPDDILVGFDSAYEPVEPYEIPRGTMAIAAWYD